MLTKIHLFYQIRKFYSICGAELGSNFINNLSDITNDNLYDVLYDINEVYDPYYGDTDPMNMWLNKLRIQIINFRERRYDIKKIVLAILQVLIVALAGWMVLSVADILSKNLSDYNMLSVCMKLFLQ